jgi:hypothetical protein
LRSICGQSTHLNDPRLDFIPAKLTRHKEIILSDLRELVSVASNEHEKACVVLAGSILEAVLFTFLEVHETETAFRRGSFTFDPNQSLQNYLDIFNKWFGADIPKLQLSNLLVHYRNLVHFNQELSSPMDERGKAAREPLRNLDSLIGELDAYGRGTP